MSDAGAISQFSQYHLAAEVSVKVAAKAKDVAQQQGAAAISLLESAAELSRSMAVEAGKGERIDVTG